jgi:uncharacterized protein involved in exopolysaccharide biosynthesis
VKPDGALGRQLSRLYEREITNARLEVEHEVLTSIYADLARRYEQGRLEAIARATALEIVDPAVAPAQPTYPRANRILAIALVGGLVLSLAGVFVLDAVRQGRTRVVANRVGGSPAPRELTGREEPRLVEVERRNGI